MSTATKAPPTDTGRCGTPAGYSRHYRRKQRPCTPCQTANTAADIARRRRVLAQRPPVDDLPPRFAWLAGLDVAHPFRALWPTMGAPLCADCLGFSDDVRHLVVLP